MGIFPSGNTLSKGLLRDNDAWMSQEAKNRPVNK